MGYLVLLGHVSEDFVKSIIKAVGRYINQATGQRFLFSAHVFNNPKIYFRLFSVHDHQLERIVGRICKGLYGFFPESDRNGLKTSGSKRHIDNISSL